MKNDLDASVGLLKEEQEIHQEYITSEVVVKRCPEDCLSLILLRKQTLR